MASYKHSVVLACLVVLIGKLNGEEATSEPPKKTCDEEVQQLLGQIESAANESQQQVSSAAQNLQSNITAIQEEVKQLLAEVDSKAKHLPTNRSEECTTELPQLDESALKLCSENANLNIVTQVGQIGNLKGHASQICAICGAEANDCVTSNVNEVQEQVKSLQSEISSQIENAQDEAAECTQELRDSAANAINDASANLDSCGGAEE